MQRYTFPQTKPNKSRKNRHGMGAQATAKNGSSGGLRAELSGLSLRAGRDAIAERLPSARRHSPP